MIDPSDKKDEVIFLNQRRAPRISAEIEVTVSGPHNFFTGFTQNMSQGGLFIATHQVYPIGTEFSIAMSLEGEELSIIAKVAWVRESTPFLPEGIDPGMGLCFIDLPSQIREHIEEFLKKKEPLFVDVEEE
jgi:uncharacterized protein (TIGR02266 family)